MPKLITCEGLRARLDSREDFELVNVLSPHSFMREHIPGSINVPRDQIEVVAPRLWERDRDIVVYCASLECQASAWSAKRLEHLGFTNVTDFDGGMAHWKDAGYSVARGAQAA